MKLILLVEDDHDIRDSMVELLTDAGYGVATAGNGAEALAYLAAQPRPHLILLDLMMPVMDGFTFREEQQKNADWSRIPVVVMSADGHVIEKQARTGAADYLKKPVDIDDLLHTIARNCL